MEPEIEVLIRAHDPQQEPMLRRAIRSVAAQTARFPIRVLLETSNFGRRYRLEDLIAPDEAPDTLGFRHTDVAFEFDSRFVLLRNGIQRATAPWLYFLDCDDVLQPHGLATLHREATQGDAQLVIANVDLVTETAQGPSRVPYRQGPVTMISLLERNEVPFNAILVHRDAAQASIVECPALSLYEDYGFLLTLLSKVTPLILPPEVIVADYNTGVGQAQKYADVRAFSLEAIDALRARLTFPVRGDDLIGAGTDPVHEKANAALLALLPETPIAEIPVDGFVETVQPAGRTRRVEGWCFDQTAPLNPIWGVYAVLSDDCAVLLSARTTRADVSAARGIDGHLQGFSGIVPAEGQVEVWIVYGDHKARLPSVY